VKVPLAGTFNVKAAGVPACCTLIELTGEMEKLLGGT